MTVVWGKALNSDDLCAIKSAYWHRAGPHGGSVDMHRASAALRDTAAEFCAGQTDHVAQHPEKRRIGFDVYLPGRSVDIDGDHYGLLPALKNRLIRAAKVDCEQTGDALSARFAPARPPAATAAYGSRSQGLPTNGRSGAAVMISVPFRGANFGIQAGESFSCRRLESRLTSNVSLRASNVACVLLTRIV
jgi:hypothetical protein